MSSAPASFDPGELIPDAYDIFCEGCGYSLAGLTSDRCPECGKSFEPRELPFARVPWLHRKRLGRVRAYWTTVAMVSFSPRRFARELCRPVRISVRDAQSFRRTTLWIATISVAVVYGVVPVIWFFGAFGLPRWWSVLQIGLILLNLLAGVAAFHLFLRLITDMPLFIWKGLPSLPASELAPVHQYASAPLAFVPLAALLVGFLVLLLSNSEDPDVAQTCAVAGVLGALAIWLWAVALLLMRAASGASGRRVIAMALYLPVHWLIMFALVGLIGAAVGAGEGYLLHAFEVRF